VAAVRIEQARQSADEQRRRAEKHFDTTLQTVDLLTRVALEALENTPQMEESQLRLLKRAQGHLTELLADRPDDLAVRWKLALVYQRLGAIWRQHGRYDLARKSYTSALDYFQRLAADDPEEEAVYRHQWAVCQNELGETYRVTRPAEARAHYDLALQAQEKLLAGSADPIEARELARTENNLGLLLLEGGKLPGARRYLDRAARRLEPLPHGPAFDADRARVWINRGNGDRQWGGVLSRQDRPAEAKEAFRQARRGYARAIELLERLRERQPSKHDYQYKLGTASLNLGELLGGLGNLAEARLAHEKARGLFQRLAENFPRYHLYRKELAQACNNLGIVLAGQGHLAEAQEAFLQAQRLSAALARDPGLAEYKDLAARSRNNLAYLAFKLQRNFSSAQRWISAAIPLQQAALDANPRNPAFLYFLAEQYLLLADVFDKQDHPHCAAWLLIRQASALANDTRLPATQRRAEAQRLEQRARELARAAARPGK
jgi:tetratricopeptide (TPR) repeat protein